MMSTPHGRRAVASVTALLTGMALLSTTSPADALSGIRGAYNASVA